MIMPALLVCSMVALTTSFYIRGVIEIWIRHIRGQILLLDQVSIVVLDSTSNVAVGLVGVPTDDVGTLDNS